MCIKLSLSFCVLILPSRWIRWKVVLTSSVPNIKGRKILCHFSISERSSSSQSIYGFKRRYEKVFQAFSRLRFSLSTWLRLSLPVPMRLVTERQAIVAVSCRLVSFCSGSQRHFVCLLQKRAICNDLGTLLAFLCIQSST